MNYVAGIRNLSDDLYFLKNTEFLLQNIFLQATLSTLHDEQIRVANYDHFVKLDDIWVIALLQYRYLSLG